MKKILFLVVSLLISTSLIASDPSKRMLDLSDWTERTPAQAAADEALLAKFGLAGAFDSAFGRGEAPVGYVANESVMCDDYGRPVIMDGKEVIVTQYFPVQARKATAVFPGTPDTLRSVSSASAASTTPQAVLSPVAFSDGPSFYYSERKVRDRSPRLVRGGDAMNKGYVSE